MSQIRGLKSVGAGAAAPENPVQPVLPQIHERSLPHLAKLELRNAKFSSYREMKAMIRLKYGNTNTFYIPGRTGGLLVDTDYAGTIYAFFKAIKDNRIAIKDIEYVIATHYHPDHMGLISELMKQGVKLLLMDVQQSFVHFSDRIFEKDKLPYAPIDESSATVISCAESRSFLARMGIAGEIIHTPSHSDDSVSLMLDDGTCFVGDLEPYEYLQAYEENLPLKNDWTRLLAFHPTRILYAHAPETHN